MSNTEPLKCCKDLLGLWFTEPECEYDRYVHAFSFDKNILIDMLNKNIKDEEKMMYSIEPVKIYSLSGVVIKKSNKESLLLHRIEDNFPFKNIFDPIYGFNKISSNECEQVLLTVDKKDIMPTIENMGISSNPIHIDTFYEEGILNT
jgi:uncharacterized ubiquitin-like protein YukD